MLLRKLRKLVPGKEEYNGRIMLPVEHLLSIAKRYKPNVESNKEVAPVLLVAIYNVEQLADEIVKALKNCTCNSSDSNNSTDKSPIPPLASSLEV